MTHRFAANCNFLVNFGVIFVAITEFVTFGFRMLFFRGFSDYSTESFTLFACQPERLISLAFFIEAM